MKPLVISIVISVVLVGGALLFSQNRNFNSSEKDPNNSEFIDGKQIIKITAKGGYFPRISLAKADIPTILKVETRGTFDCASALTIPAISYRANLPQSGITEINLPPQKAGTTLQGLCAMGMYNFQIKFD